MASLKFEKLVHLVGFIIRKLGRFFLTKRRELIALLLNVKTQET